MQSWKLKDFVKKYGPVTAGRIWGKSHQAVGSALDSRREIKIVLVNGYFEVHEFKLLGRSKASNINLPPL